MLPVTIIIIIIITYRLFTPFYINRLFIATGLLTTMLYFLLVQSSTLNKMGQGTEPF